MRIISCKIPMRGKMLHNEPMFPSPKYNLQSSWTKQHQTAHRFETSITTARYWCKVKGGQQNCKYDWQLNVSWFQISRSLLRTPNHWVALRYVVSAMLYMLVFHRETLVRSCLIPALRIQLECYLWFWLNIESSVWKGHFLPLFVSVHCHAYFVVLIAI